ncbi:MAG: hypothetical protein WD278_13865 [Pirellulales bacterium]
MQTGITLYHMHDVAVVDLIVQGFQLDGINAHDGVRSCYLSGITCRGNGRHWTPVRLLPQCFDGASVAVAEYATSLYGAKLSPHEPF